MSSSAMKNRGFTLIELVIVMVLIGISSVISLRFISDMAHSQASTAERSQALAGARFAMERLRRELKQAYSPSVYVSNDGGLLNSCINFVPVIAAGSYTESVKDSNAKFILPFNVTAEQLALANMAINAPSASSTDLAAWQNYPEGALPDNVMSLKANITLDNELSFAELFDNPSSFSFDSAKQRYTLLKKSQVRFCAAQGELTREVREGAIWKKSSLMLTGLKSNNVFGSYSQASQLITVDFTLATRDGDLVLPSQLQVGYEP